MPRRNTEGEPQVTEDALAASSNSEQPIEARGSLDVRENTPDNRTPDEIAQDALAGSSQPEITDPAFTGNDGPDPQTARELTEDGQLKEIPATSENMERLAAEEAERQKNDPTVEQFGDEEEGEDTPPVSGRGQTQRDVSKAITALEKAAQERQRVNMEEIRARNERAAQVDTRRTHNLAAGERNARLLAKKIEDARDKSLDAPPPPDGAHLPTNAQTELARLAGQNNPEFRDARGHETAAISQIQAAIGSLQNRQGVFSGSENIRQALRLLEIARDLISFAPADILSDLAEPRTLAEPQTTGVVR